MGSSISERLDAAAAVMDRVCTKFLEDPAASLIPLKTEGNDELERCGLAAFEYVHPMRTITSIKNRGTDILEPANVPIKIENITDTGFNPALCAEASGIRMPADATKRNEIEDANARLHEESGGVTPPVVKGMALLQVTAACHTTAGLKAVHYECECDIGSISINNKLNAEKIKAKSPSYAKPLDTGLRYFVVEHAVIERWPAYELILIEASNAGNSNSKPDSPIQLMLKLHTMAAEFEARGLAPDQAIMVKRILRTKPEFANDVPAMAKYVVSWSGGTKNPHLLRRFQEFARTLQHVVEPAACLDSVATVEMGKGLGGRFRCAILMSEAKHPNKVHSGHVGTLAKRNNLAALNGEKAMVEFGDAIDAAAKKKLPPQISPAYLKTISGDHDITIVHHVLNINKSFKSLIAISCAKFVEFSNAVVAFGGKAPINPFEPLDQRILKQPAAPKVAQDGQTRMQELSTKSGSLSDAALLDLAKDNGLIVDAVVTKKGDKDDAQYDIITIDASPRGSIATICDRKDKRRKIQVSIQELLDKFQKKKLPTVNLLKQVVPARRKDLPCEREAPRGA